MQYQRLDTHNWTQWREAILLLEAQIYEPSRQDTPETLERIICNERGISLAAVEGQRLAGFCLGAPLGSPMFAALQRIRQGGVTPYFTQQTPWWTHITGVRGSAGKLKSTDRDARLEGFKSVCGRNRAGLANAMWQLNTSLGARAVHIIEKDYQDGLAPDICIYYHIALSAP